jgi:stage IV sporulation protein FB
VRRFVAVGRMGGVPVYIHWTLVVACALVLLPSLRSMLHTSTAASGIGAYFAALLLHEWGHVVLARRRGYQVYEIDLYPFVGLTRIEHPRTPMHQCVIAWGGVLFQAALGIPLLAWIILVGYTPIDAVNAFMAVFGYLTLVTVPLNLAPIPPLDGASAWRIVPLLIRRARERRGGRRHRGWQSLR